MAILVVVANAVVKLLLLLLSGPRRLFTLLHLARNPLLLFSMLLSRVKAHTLLVVLPLLRMPLLRMSVHVVTGTWMRCRRELGRCRSPECRVESLLSEAPELRLLNDSVIREAARRNDRAQVCDRQRGDIDGHGGQGVCATLGCSTEYIIYERATSARVSVCARSNAAPPPPTGRKFKTIP